MSLDKLPGVAEVAMQQGIYASQTIKARLRGHDGDRKPFRYRDLGSMATISRFRAVVSFKGIRVSGFPGWLMWLCVHLAFMTGFKNRFITVVQWGLAFIGKGRSERTLTLQEAVARVAIEEAGGRPFLLRITAEDAPGGTEGKLETPRLEADQWPREPHLNSVKRPLAAGDELLVNDHRVKIVGRSETLPRFPPRPLLYTTFSNATRILLPERRRLTFVLATASPGIAPRELATRIHVRTGLRARTSDDFKADTVRWYLSNSEDVGDSAAMLTLAMSVGFGVTGIMLYMFTNENLKQYAVLKAMGATSRLLLAMILVQAGLCALVGTGLGLGLCAIIGQVAMEAEYPFRMMWFTPLIGGVMVVLVSVVAAAISVRPVLRLEPALVFAGR
jgi:hypothetical protein